MKQMMKRQGNMDVNNTPQQTPNSALINNNFVQFVRTQFPSTGMSLMDNAQFQKLQSYGPSIQNMQNVQRIDNLEGEWTPEAPGRLLGNQERVKSMNAFWGSEQTIKQGSREGFPEGNHNQSGLQGFRTINRIPQL
jgi:hypothetical protein